MIKGAKAGCLIELPIAPLMIRALPPLRLFVLSEAALF
jgi:hypothetical protein